MDTLHDINLTFLQQKGFKTTALEGLNKALNWLKTTDADCLMHGKGTGDPFDIMVGEMRRPMLIASVEHAIMQFSE
ncbi:hypothetical protein [Ruminococcus flavefaciens]|uniref:hypothetical protein n=1 Tax=Ruminococcus flavefaciens TaxID=1265 RepID=UPI0002F7F32E|nr:hypothetical protein [Ruminococcus flavefaciens]